MSSKIPKGFILLISGKGSNDNVNKEDAKNLYEYCSTSFERSKDSKVEESLVKGKVFNIPVLFNRDTDSWYVNELDYYEILHDALIDKKVPTKTSQFINLIKAFSIRKTIFK